jgi:FkbM family methyltransferase
MDFEAYLREPFAFEDEVNKIFKPNEKITIMDIGACEGEDSIKLKNKFPNASIYSFEPLPKNIKRIKNNFSKNSIPSNRIFQLALSNENGAADFYVSSGQPNHLPKVEGWDYGNKSSSLLPPKKTSQVHPWLKFNKKIKVKTQRLEDFCKEHGIRKIDFIYLDVQGAELKVLEGIGRLLETCRAIWVEVEAVELYSKQPIKQDVELFMKSRGFKCIKSTVDDVSGDQLYVRKDMLNYNFLSRLKGRR